MGNCTPTQLEEQNTEFSLPGYPKNFINYMRKFGYTELDNEEKVCEICETYKLDPEYERLKDRMAFDIANNVWGHDIRSKIKIVI
jgi:hypothetical protein